MQLHQAKNGVVPTLLAGALVTPVEVGSGRFTVEDRQHAGRQTDGHVDVGRVAGEDLAGRARALAVGGQRLPLVEVDAARCPLDRDAVRQGAQDYLIKSQIEGGVLLRALRRGSLTVKPPEVRRCTQRSRPRPAIVASTTRRRCWSWRRRGARAMRCSRSSRPSVAY